MLQTIQNHFNYQSNKIKKYRNQPIPRVFVDEHARASLLNLAGVELKMAEHHYNKAIEFIKEYEEKIRK